MSIKENLSALFQKIEAVTQQSEENVKRSLLLLFQRDDLQMILKRPYTAGCRDFGENRIPEALEKMELCPQDIRCIF